MDQDRARAAGVSEDADQKETSEPRGDQTFIAGYTAEPETISTNNTTSLSLIHRKKHYEEQRDKLIEKVHENEENLTDLERQIRSQVSPEDYFVNAFFEDKHIRTELQDKIISQNHQSTICNELWLRFASEDEFLIESMNLCCQFRKVLSGMNLLSDEYREKVNSLQRKLMGKKSVSWRDDRQCKSSAIGQVNVDDLASLPIYISLPRTPKHKEKGLETLCIGKTPTLNSYTEQRALNTTFTAD